MERSNLMAVNPKVFDFTNVSDGSGYRPKRKPAGEYLAVLVSVEEKESNQGNDMWVFAAKLKSDPTAVYPIHCTLNESSLWKLRNLIMATGAAAPKKRVKIDPQKLLNREIGLILDDHEYDGKESSQVTATIPVGELTEEEPAPTPAKKAAPKAVAKKKAQPEPDDDDDDVDDEDLEELDLEEL
jgi:hypothetical protein